MADSAGERARTTLCTFAQNVGELCNILVEKKIKLSKEEVEVVSVFFSSPHSFNGASLLSYVTH